MHGLSVLNLFQRAFFCLAREIKILFGGRVFLFLLVILLLLWRLLVVLFLILLFLFALLLLLLLLQASVQKLL